MTSFIPVNTPVIGSREKELVMECLSSGWISCEGPFVAKFEEEFSKRVGRKYGISCSNGTAALDIAVSALRIGPGDEVILPSFTIISCAAAIFRAGATPVVVDSDPITWNMDVSAIEASITPRTVAIMAVHIYGLPVDMQPLLAISKKYNLALIEDAAELIGGEYKGHPCGSFGDISTFSFYPNKHITTGEGGMVVTNDQDLAERCKSLRNLCFQPNQRFVHEELGWNYRITNLQAALGLGQLESLDKFLDQKRKMGATYNEAFKDIPDLQLPIPTTSYASNLYWVYGLVVGESHKNASFYRETLAKAGIGTRPFFYPIHQQPVFRKMGYFLEEHKPVAEKLYDKGFYIPSGLGLSHTQQLEVIEACKNALSIYKD